MRRVLPLILALALGAAAPLPPRPDADPVSLIAAIYGTYENDTPALPHIYSKRLQALVDKDARETPKGELGRIDWDMFVDGQVWKLSKLKISLVSKSAGHAEVRATFMNYSEPNIMLFELLSEGGSWRIDDIQKAQKPRWSMSKILMDAPDAFPDAKPEAK